MDILTFIGCCISLTILWENGILDIYGHVIPDFVEQELEKLEETYIK